MVELAEKRGLGPRAPQGGQKPFILRDLTLSLDLLALRQAAAKLPVDEPDGLVKIVFGVNPAANSMRYSLPVLRMRHAMFMKCLLEIEPFFCRERLLGASGFARVKAALAPRSGTRGSRFF